MSGPAYCVPCHMEGCSDDMGDPCLDSEACDSEACFCSIQAPPKEPAGSERDGEAPAELCRYCERPTPCPVCHYSEGDEPCGALDCKVNHR